MPNPIIMNISLNPADAVTLTQDLVRINTTNPPGNESPAVILVEARLRSAGFETVVVPYHDGENRSHVVARLRGTGQRPGLLFSGHIDVVPQGGVPWSVAPFGGDLRDGKLFGRGSCDMKGGVSALVVAAEAIARTCSQSGTRLEGDLVVAVTADEERNCLGADELVKERELFEGLGAALVAEPTSLGLYIAEKGAFWVELEFFGKTAHGSMPRMGANAIGAAAEFLVRWEQEYRTDEPVHPLLGTPTLNVGMINGGVKVNVVADHCAVQLDMRTVPGLEHSDLRRRLERLAAAVCASRAGTSARLNIVSDRASVSCPEDSELAVALGATLQDLTAKAPQFGGVPYCTEACIWVPHLQVPAVICGPGSAGMAHQPDEYVETSELELAARAYAATAAQLLAGY